MTLETELSGDGVDSDDDRKLGEVLREGEQRTTGGRHEKEEDLLLRQRLELVHASSWSVRDPVDAAVLGPRCSPCKVVREPIPVVRRRSEDEKQLIRERSSRHQGERNDYR